MSGPTWAPVDRLIDELTQLVKREAQPLDLERAILDLDGTGHKSSQRAQLGLRRGKGSRSLRQGLICTRHSFLSLRQPFASTLRGLGEFIHPGPPVAHAVGERVRSSM